MIGIYLKLQYPISEFFPRRRWGCNPASWPDKTPDDDWLVDLKKFELDFYIKKYRNLLTAKKTTNLES